MRGAATCFGFFTTIIRELLYVIQINHQPDATIFQFIILTYLQLNMFRAFSRPSSGAQ